MKVGSLVEVVTDFTDLVLQYRMPYPRKGDILTVSQIKKHPRKKVRKKGIVLLYFEECPDTVGICNKTVKDKKNFVELQPPMSTAFIKKVQQTKIINYKTFSYDNN